MYYLELNGKQLDLSYPISSYLISSSSVLTLRMRQNVLSNELCRVAVQYDNKKSSVAIGEGG